MFYGKPYFTVADEGQSLRNYAPPGHPASCRCMLLFVCSFGQGKGYFAECGLRNAESCQRVICGKFDADFFCGMKGKVRNETMRNVTGMNIY